MTDARQAYDKAAEAFHSHVLDCADCTMQGPHCEIVMSSFHVWTCDECGKETRTHNDYECLRLPGGWSARHSEQGLSCEDCTAQLKLLAAALE